MACITFAQPLAMATTQLERAIRFEDACNWRHVEVAERSSLRMSWVVVTDNDGNRQLKMVWTPSANSR